jgi:hypothetical protein
MRRGARTGWAPALLAAAAVMVLERRTAADVACSLPEGPGLLAPKVDALPACVSSRCSEAQRWSSSARGRRADTRAPGQQTPAGAGSSWGRDVVVPDACRTVPEALETARAGDRVFFREGRFAWDHMAVVREHMHIAGDDKSCLLGPWLLQEGTAGLFQGVCCAVRHSAADAAVLPDATVTSFSASWILEDCELRAVHAPVLRLLDNANMTLLYCNVGGVGGGDGSANDDLLRATDAVVAMASSNLLLYRCRIEDTGDADSRPPRDLKGNIISLSRASGPVGVRILHPYGRRSSVLLELPGEEPQDQQPEFPLHGGVRLFESAKARLEQCSASNNDVTLSLSGRASAMVHKCKLKCSAEAFALLRAVRCQPKSRLVLRGNLLQGTKWLNAQRPSEVRDDDDDGLCPWEEEGVAPAVVPAQEEAAHVMKRGRGRPAKGPPKPSKDFFLSMPTGPVLGETRGGGARRRGGTQGHTHRLSEENLSERDLTVLRLGALGIFNVSFDEFGHVILPPQPLCTNAQDDAQVAGSRGDGDAGDESEGGGGGGGAALGEESAVEGYWQEYLRGKSEERSAAAANGTQDAYADAKAYLERLGVHVDSVGGERGRESNNVGDERQRRTEAETWRKAAGDDGAVLPRPSGASMDSAAPRAGDDEGADYDPGAAGPWEPSAWQASDELAPTGIPDCGGGRENLLGTKLLNRGSRASPAGAGFSGMPDGGAGRAAESESERDAGSVAPRLRGLQYPGSDGCGGQSGGLVDPGAYGGASEWSESRLQLDST